MTATRSRNGRTNHPNAGPVRPDRTQPKGPAQPNKAKRPSDNEPAPAPGEGLFSAVGPFATITNHGGWHRWVLGWFFCAVTAWAHLAAVNWLNINLSTSAAAPVVIASLLLPAAVTAWFVPSARRGAWRWLVLLSLMTLTVGESAMVTLIVGETVLLHRWWVSERVHGYVWAPLDGGR